MNKVILIGRTTKDIEFKTTPTGTSVATFSLAVNRNLKNKGGEYESDFFNCVSFSNLADTISRYVKKGDKIGVEGRLQTRNYTNNEGRTVYITEVIVENIEFLQPKPKDTAPETEEFEEIDPFKELPF
jgi:single-strand DNA-binding protein